MAAAKGKNRRKCLGFHYFYKNVYKLIRIVFFSRSEGRNSVSFNLPPLASTTTRGSGGVAGATTTTATSAGTMGDGSEDYRQMYDTCSDILNSFQQQVNSNNR